MRDRGTHRLPPPSSALRGRMVVAAVAAGAFAAATAGQALESTTEQPDEFALASAHGAYGARGIGGDTPVAAPVLVPVEQTSNASAEAKKLANSLHVTDSRKKREAAALRKAREEAARPDVVLPTAGRLTSGFGARWGTSHNGIDLAAPIGTPIVAAADGVVLEAGQASGFGYWIRIQHDDGTVSVYGHMYDGLVAEGQQVQAGDKIAEVGNNGQSTGPHLHFEIWQGENGTKIDPLGWLQQNGVSI